MHVEDLKTLFPISPKWIVQRVILCLIIIFTVLFFMYELESLLGIQDLHSVYRETIFYALILSMLFIGYSVLYLLSYEYKLVGDEIIIRRGVIIKKPVGIPLNKINAIHVTRKINEFIFGISTVVIVVPGGLSSDLSSISGLTLKDAEAFKAYIFGKN